MYSVCDALAGLESTIRRLLPQIAFFFADEAKARAASGPRVLWIVEGSDERAPADPVSPTRGLGLPRVFDADWVTITARCYGAPGPSASPAEQDPRRRELAASEHLQAAVRWALRRGAPSGAEEWTGVSRVRSWQVIQPQGPEDQGTPIDLTFQLHLRLIAPAPQVAQPDTATVEGMEYVP